MMPIEPDHYGILELAPGSPMEEVKGQYRRLAKRYHPDLHGNDATSQEKFRRINAAYTFLSDAPRKAAYDDILKAARRLGAPPPKAAPPSPTATGYHATPTATGYHAPRVAANQTGYHPRPADDVRMTRSAWLGGTAGAIVVLLVIGLSLNSPGPGRPQGVEVAAPASSGGALDGGNTSGLGDGAGPTTDPLSRRAPAPFAAPSVPPPPPAPAARAWAPPRFPGPDSARAWEQRLLARARPAPPPTDRPAVPDAKPDRVLRGRPAAAAMKGLSAARARPRPAASRAPQGTPEERRRGTEPVRADLRRVEDAARPGRDDPKALSARATPPAPTQGAPAPFITAPAPPPAPAEKPEAKQAAKVKAPAPPGQEFIMWGK